MMFFGPKAASPPKNTPGRVDWKVLGSTLGTLHLSNSMPRSRSIHGNAFSWPIASITSSQGSSSSPSTRSAVILPSCEFVLHLLEQHAGELAALDHEALRRAIDDDLDVLALRILELPVGGLEESARLARHDLDAAGAQAERGPAAIHRRVADADDQHPLADLVDVLEGHRLEPVDADVDAVGVAPARQIEFLALGRARAHEHRVEPLPFEQFAHAAHRRAEAQLDAHVENHADFLVEHRLRQAEGGNIAAHQAAGGVEALEDHDFVAERRQVVGDRERGGSGADAGDALAVALEGRARRCGR